MKTYLVAAVVGGGKKTKQDVHRLLVGCTDSVKTYLVDVFVAARKLTRHCTHTTQKSTKTYLVGFFGCYEKRIRHHANARKDVPYSVVQPVSDKYRASVRVRFHNVVACVFTISPRTQRNYAKTRAQHFPRN